MFGEETDLRSECMLYTQTLHTNMTWQSICYWPFEDRFQGDRKLAKLLAEDVAPVISGRVTADVAAQGMLRLANS